MLLFVCVFLLIYTLVFPTECAYFTTNAVKLCINAVIPSLFLPIALSKIIAKEAKNIHKGKLCKKISSFLSISPNLFYVCLTGLVFGAPSGAIGVCEVYSSHLCSKEQAENAFLLTSSCSFSFILGFLGNILSSRHNALIILTANVITTIFLYFLFFTKVKNSTSEKKSEEKEPKDFLKIVTSSVSDTITSVLTLCSFVLFFNVLSEITVNIICNLFVFSPHTKDLLCCFVRMFFEMSQGAVFASSFLENERIVLCAVGVAFCGLSIILQTVHFAKIANLDTKKLMLCKFLSSLLCPSVCLLLLFLFPTTRHNSFTEHLPYFSKYLMFLIFFCILFVTILRSLIKNTKRKS